MPDNSGQDASTAFDNSGIHKEGWFSQNVAPLIALATVIITFMMFWGFIQVAKNPLEEIKNLYSAQEKSAAFLLQNKNLDSASVEEKKRAEDEIRLLQDNVVNAKAALDAAKEQRSMVKDIILYILGVLSSTITTIFSYYFGSSKSSAKKDEALARKDSALARKDSALKKITDKGAAPASDNPTK